MVDVERSRLHDAEGGGIPWRRWGPYLSERQWGTVREDYSAGGDAWSSFTHDQARSRAYRWGEDGLAGFSDDHQRLCLALALWNGRDPILKERLFGLTNSEGNHGEDVKECYFYLDATPTSSYLKMLYKYPQAAFPYADLVATNAGADETDPEYELLDTGVFDDGRYFDVFVEYAKATPEDILMQVTVHNRGPDDCRAARPTDTVVPAHVVVGRWTHTPDPASPFPAIRAERRGSRTPRTGNSMVLRRPAVPVLVTENETNNERVFGTANDTRTSRTESTGSWCTATTRAVQSEGRGTKAAFHCQVRGPGRRVESPCGCGSPTPRWRSRHSTASMR